MTDAELTERPGQCWTPWRAGSAAKVSLVWWQAKELHFPKLNVTVWFDGSDLVGVEHWGYRRQQWTMKKPAADWRQLPLGYREAVGRAWLVWKQIKRQADG